jgi:cyclopropane-fatty-acyl-phospholipid synthase
MSLGASIDRWAERQVLAALARLAVGQVNVHVNGNVHSFGTAGWLTASLYISNRRFFRRVITGGEIGLGDAYMDGDWSTPDLVSLVRIMLANRDVVGALPSVAAWLPRAFEGLAHRRRDNTPAGSRRNIQEHYDLGNEFFRLFLDSRLMYSCALFEDPGDTLEAAQVNKLRAICDKLALGPDDHVLEIGSGWGGFALFAATYYGCRVTTTTISARQYDHVADSIARAGDAGQRVDLRFEDYRQLRGRFDKIVSIEMFEAVGLAHYDDYFAACDRLLDRDGVMLLQTITVDDWRFAEYRSEPNWISKRIFPGAELASVAEILASMARISRLTLHHAQQIGTHYARTLHCWRERFSHRRHEVHAQGFDDRFTRMWDLYLGYCEAAFLDRHIGDVQLLLAKAATRRVLFDEPWNPAMAWSAARTDRGRGRGNNRDHRGRQLCGDG